MPSQSQDPDNCNDDGGRGAPNDSGEMERALAQRSRAALLKEELRSMQYVRSALCSVSGNGERTRKAGE